jgi:citrate synthase
MRICDALSGATTGQIRRDRHCSVFTYDPGFTSTASCESKITYIDGDEGRCCYRGYPIEQLAEQSTSSKPATCC